MKPRILWGMGVLALYFVRHMNFPAESFVDRPPKRWPKKRAKYGGPTLVKTGRLRDSWRVLSQSHNEVRVGTTVPYAIKHQVGRGNMPERQMIGHSKVLAEATGRFLINQLNEAMKA